MGSYVEENKEKIQNVPGGTLCQVFGESEGASCSVAIVTMDENGKGIKHYHKEITEIYLFAKGEGKIVINENINEVKEGDCYIISPNNVHYIEAKTNMSFLCICTPPWTEEREFAVLNEVDGDNISKYDGLGVLQVLSNEEGNNIKLYKIDKVFVPNEIDRKYRRVYYCLSGEAKIKVNGFENTFMAGDCYEIDEHSIEEVIPNVNIKFVLVCDKIR